jgi:hypothetical protein
MAKCPHCDAVITEVYFRCDTYGTESGTIEYRPNRTNPNDEGSTDTEYGDSETTDSDNYTYSCPECTEEIDINHGDVAAWFHAQELAELKEKKSGKKAINALGNFPKRKKVEAEV